MLQFARLSAGRAKRIVYGMFGGGDADSSRMVDCKRCIVGGQASIEAFDLDERPNLALAEKYWAEVVKGSHGFLRTATDLPYAALSEWRRVGARDY